MTDDDDGVPPSSQRRPFFTLRPASVAEIRRRTLSADLGRQCGNLFNYFILKDSPRESFGGLAGYLGWDWVWCECRWVGWGCDRKKC